VPPQDSASFSTLSFDQVVDRVSQTEAQFVKNLVQFSPVVETYIQNLKPDKELGAMPVSDEYFLGKLDFTRGMDDKSFLKPAGLGSRFVSKLSGFYSPKYMPLGFAQMIVIDGRQFDRAHYDFKFVRREFLGELRTIVMDVSPKKGSGKGRFLGRIWVEDRDYNVVRFNGTFAPPKARNGTYLHFDTWRLNMGPGLWLPAYVYTEESGLKPHLLARELHFKGQTRLWGYALRQSSRQDEFTQMTVDPADGVRDQSGSGQDLSPVQAERAWQRQAEQNVLARLQKAGLLAPQGEVDKAARSRSGRGLRQPGHGGE
jgi:hypothetical protein